MTMILDAFMSKFSELLMQMVQDEVGMLLGVPGEIEKLQLTVRDIQCVIADADKKQIQNTTIKNWLTELKDVMYDADDIMDLCQIKAEERRERSDPPSSSKFSCGLLSCLRNPLFAHKIGTKVKEINSRLEGIAKRRANLGLSEIQKILEPSPIRRVDTIISRKTDPVMEEIVGEKIEEDAGVLVSWLTEKESGVRGNVGVVAIMGMGGIGKTTLAKRIFNDSKIKEEFKLTIWVCVSKEVKAGELLKCIIREAGGEPGAAQERSELVPKLKEVIKGKKFFLVLDDVWPESVAVWNELLLAPMKGAAEGSRLLVTTRDERVAIAIKATRSHRVDKMSDEDGWSLLIKQIFEDEEESDIQRFKDIGLSLVKKCDGLPLAIKSIGGVLCMKSKTIVEWQAVLENNAWSIEGLPDGVHQALYLSYEDLSSPLKQCFVLFSLYPEDHILDYIDLIYLWFAEGFLHGNYKNCLELGREYYMELLQRNLLEDNGEHYDKSMCKMHDLLWSFAHYLGKDENYIFKGEKVLNKPEYIAKLRRLSIQENMVDLKDLKKEKGLRTLLIKDTSDNALVDLCTPFPNLRILELRSTSISTLPDSFSNLVHLRYLDASYSNVENIPESIGCLRNLVYLNFMCCKELRYVPHSITKLVKLMYLNFVGSRVEGIPKGLRRLENLSALIGLRPSNNSLEMFSSLDELRTLSRLAHVALECLERVTDKATAEGAKLLCKDQLQYLWLAYTELSWEDQMSQTDDKKATTEGVLNELCPPTSVQYLSIINYFGSTLPNWLNLGIALPNLIYLEIKNCNCFVHLAPLGQLPNLNYLRIEGAHSILSVGEEFFWGDGKSRDTTAGSCSVVPAFPKLNELFFESMGQWHTWQWNKGESAMLKLKGLYIKNCPQLRSLPEGLVHHATSLEFLQIISADNLTTIENFRSINDFRVFRNSNLEKISNLPCVSHLHIEDCPNMKVVEKLNALQGMILRDSEMKILPEYLMAVTLQKLQIDCSEELLRKITNEGERSPEWQKFKHISEVTIYSWDETLYATYQKTPFSFTTNIRA